MTLDLATVRATMPRTVPMVATLGLEFLVLSDDHAVLRLPDDPVYRNHVGGPHAGAMFTVAETASGALVLAHYGELLDVLTPLPIEATVRYLKVALGPVTATARFAEPIDDVLARFEAGERPEFVIDVELTTGEADERLVTGSMSIRWTLRPRRRD